MNECVSMSVSDDCPPVLVSPVSLLRVPLPSPLGVHGFSQRRALKSPTSPSRSPSRPPPTPHQQRQGKMPQSAQLMLPGFSKVASSRFRGPPFQLSHANTASLTQLRGAKVRGVMPSYRPAVPAAQQPKHWPTPPPSGYFRNCTPSALEKLEPLLNTDRGALHWAGDFISFSFSNRHRYHVRWALRREETEAR